MYDAVKTIDHPIIDRQVDPAIESLRKEKDWFIVIEGDDDSRHYYDKEQLTTELRTNILEGKYAKTNGVIIHYKVKDSNWQQTKSTLEEFAKNHFKLRVLYQPVWSHAMAGLKWGAIIGVFLKLADTFLMLLSVDAGIAFLFVLAVGVCFIPRIGWIGVAAISYFMFKFSRANFFFMALAAALVGAILGCLPGMAIGGIIGFSRKNSLSLANDAAPEPGGLLLKSVIVPLVSGAVLFVFYIFVFNPWLMGVLE